jgi:hypothetical protein
MGEFAQSLRLDAVPADVRRQAALSLLDTIGAIIITSSMAAVQPMMRTEQGKTLGSLGYSAARRRRSTSCATTLASSPPTAFGSTPSSPPACTPR